MSQAYVRVCVGKEQGAKMGTEGREAGETIVIIIMGVCVSR